MGETGNSSSKAGAGVRSKRTRGSCCGKRSRKGAVAAEARWRSGQREKRRRAAIRSGLQWGVAGGRRGCDCGGMARSGARSCGSYGKGRLVAAMVS